MNGGPFQIDGDYESILKPSDWKTPAALFGAAAP
jgi:hypothetical protein